MPALRIGYVFHSVLHAERIRNARRLNLVRLVAVTLFIVMSLVEPAVDDRGFRALAFRLDIAQWLVAFGIWLAAWTSMRAGRWSVLAIGLLDIPLVSLKSAVRTWTPVAVRQ